ncbi:Peptide ABC transporter ATP-binding protein, partial [Pseudomonas amygdali pv. mori]
RDVLARARHPYTRGLIDCQPASSTGSGLLRTIPGQPPLLDALPAGCRFHARCGHAGAGCVETLPLMRSMGVAHEAACHYPLADSREAVS